METTFLIAGLLFVVLYNVAIRLLERRAKIKGNPGAIPFSKRWIKTHAILFLGAMIVFIGALVNSFEIIVAGSTIAFIGIIPRWVDRIRRAR